MLELCGRPQLLRGHPALIAAACVAGILMHARAVIDCNAAAGSDAVQILKCLSPLHAAALSLHPAAEAATKRIVMQTEVDVQASPLSLVQLAENVFAAARLFSDSVGFHVNGLCLQLLQISSGIDDSLRSTVVAIAAAVYRSNCALPNIPIPPQHQWSSLNSLPNSPTPLPLSSLPPPNARWRINFAPQGHDISAAALHTRLPRARGKKLYR